ncbi:hypothetical protein V6260_02845 [Pseudoalteromonas aliena]|uniref:hypothetical protein n=1 Tax=Pseudoalteromonas aliena TaxID=247523 RepID=UPI00311FB7FD
MKENLTSENHREMEKFLSRVLDGYKSGNISKSDAVSGLAHVMAALDINNTPEAISWFNQNELDFFKDPTDISS